VINCRVDVFCRGNEETCRSDVAADGLTCRPSAGFCDPEEVCSGGNCPVDTFAPATTVCRRAVDTTCDAEERCTGSSATCPTDIRRDGVQCRGSMGECDNIEYCSNGRCPADTFKGNSNTCGGSPGECENQGRCSGSSATCPGHSPKSTNTPCGPQPPADPTCALRQTCDSSGNCPSGFRTKPNGAVCKQANGDCDVDDTCDGSSQTCAEKFRPTTYVCNSKNDDCGDEQTCTGSSTNCPPRPVRPNTHVCRPAVGSGVRHSRQVRWLHIHVPRCEAAARFRLSRQRDRLRRSRDVRRLFGQLPHRQQSSTKLRVPLIQRSLRPRGRCAMVSANACGPDVLHPRGYVCRDKAGPCDVADQCPGGDSQCPPDAKEVINTPCNPSKGICDVPELCDGSSNLCPADEFRPASANIVCRDPNGDLRSGRDMQRHRRRVSARHIRCRRAVPHRRPWQHVRCDGGVRAPPPTAPQTSSCHSTQTATTAPI
jgi:hypothetical protein